MNIDVGHALYSVAMILLAFVVALVLTKTISKYTKKKENTDENNC